MGLALELRADHLKKNWAEEKPKSLTYLGEDFKSHRKTLAHC